MRSSPRRPLRSKRRLKVPIAYGQRTRIIPHFDSRRFTTHFRSTRCESTSTGGLWAFSNKESSFGFGSGLTASTKGYCPNCRSRTTAFIRTRSKASRAGNSRRYAPGRSDGACCALGIPACIGRSDSPGSTANRDALRPGRKCSPGRRSRKLRLPCIHSSRNGGGTDRPN